MARIAGVTLQNEKQIGIGLLAIYGIGKTSSKKILEQLKVKPTIRVKDLSEDDVNKIREVIEKHMRVEGELRREVLGNIKRLKDIGSYRGTRHAKRLPVRGQRTRTNSRTVRGNARKTMGSGRRVLTKT